MATSFSNSSMHTLVGDVPIKLISGDWNSDNQIDLIVVNRDNSSISILQNSNGVFSVSQTLSVSEHPIQVASADWDGDNDTDLAVLSKESTLVQIWFCAAGNKSSKCFDLYFSVKFS